MRAGGSEKQKPRHVDKKEMNGKSSSRWMCNSNDVINLKLIKSEDEIFTEDSYFHPSFTNQVLFSSF